MPITLPLPLAVPAITINTDPAVFLVFSLLRGPVVNDELDLQKFAIQTTII